MKQIIGLMLLTVSCTTLADRPLEDVLHISAQQTSQLLDDETIVHISHQDAAALLGNPDETAMSIESLNNMPATAAGGEQILMISADQAQMLLGNEPQ